MIIAEYSKYDGLGLAELVRRGEVSPADLIDSAVDAIARLNPKLNCVVQQLPQHGRAQIKRGLPYGPFRGVPFLVKEFGMHFKGMVTSAGSRRACALMPIRNSCVAATPLASSLSAPPPHPRWPSTPAPKR